MTTRITMVDAGGGVTLELSPLRNALTARHDVNLQITAHDGTAVSFLLTAEDAGVLLQAIRAGTMAAAVLDFQAEQ